MKRSLIFGVSIRLIHFLPVKMVRDGLYTNFQNLNNFLAKKINLIEIYTEMLRIGIKD